MHGKKRARAATRPGAGGAPHGGAPPDRLLAGTFSRPASASLSAGGAAPSGRRSAAPRRGLLGWAPPLLPAQGEAAGPAGDWRQARQLGLHHRSAPVLHAPPLRHTYPVSGG